MTAPTPPDCCMVLFGASGDLTRRLVVPALYNLARTGLLPDDFTLIGVDISRRSTADWVASLHEMLVNDAADPAAEAHLAAVDEAVWRGLATRMHYLEADFTDPECYRALEAKLATVEGARGAGGNRLFYLAVEERFFGPIASQLGRSGLIGRKPDGGPWRRLIIEKPFGHDLASARALNAELLGVLNEDQIYRIDHFLGKAPVQNIMALRFANGVFEPLWNRDRIDHVQISVAETLGVEQRGRFYERIGALRDMIPNHLFQLLAMVAMDPPARFTPELVRDRIFELLSAIEPVRPEHAVRAQYGAGTVDGKAVGAYRRAPHVAPDSNIETFVALRLAIDNWRWAGVPFFLRTGKHLAGRRSEIAIRFRRAPLHGFRGTGLTGTPANWLVLHLQPDEGMSMHFDAREPGQQVRLAPVSMDFRYADWFTPEPNVGYETLLHDAMTGDQTLFRRADMVEQSWRVLQPVLDAWRGATEQVPLYPSGSDGPEQARRLIGQDDPSREWRPIDARPVRTAR